MQVSKGIEDFLGYLHSTEQEYHIAEANETEANGVTQDILHDIELREHTYHEYAALSKDLRITRQNRRKAKDTIAASAPVIDWINKHRQTIKELEQLLGEVRKAERYAEGRIYTPRTSRDTIS